MAKLGVVRTAVARAATFMMEKSVGSGAWLGQSVPKSWPWNFWQLDMDPPSGGDIQRFGPVQTCVDIISQDLSRIQLQHLRKQDNGAFEEVQTKAPYRLFRKPNHYQSIADFVLYLARSLLTDGNFYGVPQYNERQEISAIYPINPKMGWPYIASTGEVFYRFSKGPTGELAQLDPTEWYPAREVLHIRGQTPTHPLIGESPLVAATYPALSGMAINKANAAFFNNMGRPSGILRHPGRLDDAAMKRVKERWIDITTGPSVGSPAVLHEGMEWQQMQMTAVDAEVAKIYQLSERQIFQMFRVPPFLGGDLDKATFTNVESLIRFYILSCLGFWENLIEEALTLFFRLPSRERISFDVESALLKGNLKERMEAYGRGVQSGIYAPNEVRAKNNLPPVEHGDVPRVQQQLVPLSWGASLEPPKPGEATPPPAPSAPEDAGDDAATGSDEDGQEASERKLFLAYSRLKKVVNE